MISRILCIYTQLAKLLAMPFTPIATVSCSMLNGNFFSMMNFLKLIGMAWWSLVVMGLCGDSILGCLPTLLTILKSKQCLFKHRSLGLTSNIEPSWLVFET